MVLLTANNKKLFGIYGKLLDNNPNLRYVELRGENIFDNKYADPEDPSSLTKINIELNYKNWPESTDPENPRIFKCTRDMGTSLGPDGYYDFLLHLQGKQNWTIEFSE